MHAESEEKWQSSIKIRCEAICETLSGAMAVMEEIAGPTTSSCALQEEKKELSDRFSQVLYCLEKAENRARLLLDRLVSLAAMLG